MCPDTLSLHSGHGPRTVAMARAAIAKSDTHRVSDMLNEHKQSAIGVDVVRARCHSERTTYMSAFYYICVLIHHLCYMCPHTHL
jgi:hypothetical protein